MKTEAPPTRPVLRWHGGKWVAARRVLPFFPPHRIYTEAFCGAASVLMQKARSHGEIINDLDSEMVNVFRVLRDPKSADELERLVRLTPFAKDEFNATYGGPPSTNLIEQARRTLIRSYMGFGSDSVTRGSRTGFRSNSNRSGTTPAVDWMHYPDMIARFTARLQGVTIENRDALEVLRQHDSPGTLHFVDPPYVHSTRSETINHRKPYRHEMDDAAHRTLAECLHQLAGMVVLCGYRSPLYDDDIYRDWVSYEYPYNGHGGTKRTEVLWLNAAMVTALRESNGDKIKSLFEEAS